MPKVRSKHDVQASQEDLRRAKAFKKFKINWPWTIFGLIVVGAIASAAVWQKSREPSKSSGPAVTVKQEKAIEEIQSLAELEKLADEAEQRLMDQSATYVGKVGTLDKLAAACKRMADLAKEPEKVPLYRSKELLARYFKLVTFAEEGLDDPTEREKVKTLVKELESSQSPEVRYQVNLAKVVLDGTTLILRPDSEADFQSYLKAVGPIVTASPSDARLAALNKQFIEFFKKEKRFPSERFSELARAVISAYSGTSNLAIQVWTRELSDELLFEKFKYRDLLMKCEVGTPGAYEAYLASLPQILAGKPTPLGYARLVSAGNSFERVNRTKEAAEVYRLVAESIPLPASEELAEVIRGCESGKIRIASIGQRFRFEGTDVSGRKIQLAEILGKPVVVAFLSGADPDFEPQFKKLQADLRPLLKRGLSLVIVCVDISADALAADVVKSDSNRVWVIADPDRSSVAWKQSQAEVLPLVVLIDSVGVVQRFANLDIHLVTTIEGELSQKAE
jgi:hypothetical protein